MTTRREFFMKNPDEFYNYVWKWRGEKPITLDKGRARRDKEYIGAYLCDNMKDCETCPVPLDEYGLCDSRLDEFLDTLTTADMSEIDPEDREAVQKILDAAMKSAKEKKVMYSPEGTAEFKEFNVSDVVPPRANDAETSKKAPEMIEPAHYVLFPDINVLDVIKVILNRAELNPIESFYLGNAIKYVLRADQKGGVKDYKKAITYLTWLVESLK